MGVEQQDEYSVNVGFLQGALDATVTVDVNVILESPTSKYGEIQLQTLLSVANLCV